MFKFDTEVLSDLPSSQLRQYSSMLSSQNTVENELFHSNREWKPAAIRTVNEDKKFATPELQIIGNLGNSKCITKRQWKRLSSSLRCSDQIQKLLLTRTNFPLTEQTNVISCPKKKVKKSIFEIIKNVQNPPKMEKVSSKDDETKGKFNHQNPFNLDLNALSVYQEKKNEIERREKQKHYHIIRRQMQTKALEERVIQDMRNEKFSLPKFFQIQTTNEDKQNGTLNDLTALKDEQKNSKISQRQQREATKIRERIKLKKIQNEKCEAQKRDLKMKKQENLVFRLAKDSLSSMSHKFNGNAWSDSVDESLDCHLNELEHIETERKLNGKSGRNELNLIENMEVYNVDIDISCGQREGNKVILRNFHDALCSEPRGKSNYLHMSNSRSTSSQFNDPEIMISCRVDNSRRKLLTSLKVEQDPNDDKIILFDESSVGQKKRNINIESPIRQHIEKVEKKLKNRFLNKKIHRNVNDEKRTRFMNTSMSLENHQKPDNVNECKSNDARFSTIVISPEDMKLLPRIPNFDCEQKHKKTMDSKSKGIANFSKTHSVVSNLNNVRVDPTLPNVADILEDMKIDCKNLLNIDSLTNYSPPHFNETKDFGEKMNVESLSEMRRSYKAVISSKLEKYTMVEQEHEEDSKNISDKKQSISTPSSTSSNSSYDIGNENSETKKSKDEGAKVVEFNGIPITQHHHNQHEQMEKFRNYSLVTTEIAPPFQQPSSPEITQFNSIKNSLKASDRFHTFNTRKSANIRERIKVDSDECDVKSRVATDIDGNYVKEMFNERTRDFYRISPRSEVKRIRDIFRKNMEICWMKEKMICVEKELVDEDRVLTEMENSVKSYDRYLDALKEQEFKKTMQIMRESKEPFKEVEQMRRKFDDLMKLIEPFKMRIFVLANEFTKLIVLQNFQYLIKPLEWREKHDWIHKQADGALEKTQDSLETRTTRNLWNRDSMTVYSIKDFIENEFTKKPKPLLAFQKGAELDLAYDEIRMRSKQSLMKFHIVACSYDEARKAFGELEKKNVQCIDAMQSNMEMIQKRRNFMSNRAKILQSTVNELIKNRLKNTVSSSITRTSHTLIDFTFQKAILKKKQDTSLGTNFTSIEKMMMLERRVFDLLSECDKISSEILKSEENVIRIKRRNEWKIAKRAHRIECELNERILQFQRCIDKPKKKMQREGKLPRSKLPERKHKLKPPTPPLKFVEKQFIQAFSFDVDEDMNKVKFDGTAKKLLENIKTRRCSFSVQHLLQYLGLN